MVLFLLLSSIDNKTTEFLQAGRSEASLQLVNDPTCRGRTQTVALPPYVSPVHEV